MSRVDSARLEVTAHASKELVLILPAAPVKARRNPTTHRCISPTRVESEANEAEIVLNSTCLMVCSLDGRSAGACTR